MFLGGHFLGDNKGFAGASVHSSALLIFRVVLLSSTVGTPHIIPLQTLNYSFSYNKMCLSKDSMSNDPMLQRGELLSPAEWTSAHTFRTAATELCTLTLFMACFLLTLSWGCAAAMTDYLHSLSWGLRWRNKWNVKLKSQTINTNKCGWFGSPSARFISMTHCFSVFFYS